MEPIPSQPHQQKIIFISHINEEAPIAKAIKEELEKNFNDTVKVFLSETIPFGDDWQQSLNTALRDADLILVLFSPDSVERPWINIEAGYGIIATKEVIPVYCFGLNQDKLHYIYQRLMGVDINDLSKIRTLLQENIAKDLLDIKVSNEAVDSWIKSWEANVGKTATSYFNQQVIKVKLPYQSYFHIYNEVSDRCLDVFAWSKKEKEIIGYALHGGNNQLWQLQKTDEGTCFRIMSRHSNLYLGIADDHGEDLTVRQYKYSHNDSQKWDLTQISNNNYKLSCLKYSDQDLCLTIEKNDKDPKTSNIFLSQWAHRWEQKWMFKITAIVTPV